MGVCLNILDYFYCLKSLSLGKDRNLFQQYKTHKTFKRLAIIGIVTIKKFRGSSKN